MDTNITNESEVVNVIASLTNSLEKVTNIAIIQQKYILTLLKELNGRCFYKDSEGDCSFDRLVKAISDFDEELLLNSNAIKLNPTETISADIDNNTRM